ncbi:alpha/beta fold hydrolase [Brevibacterium aurantiacum]|uniref:Alpha/beta hydrolase n=1 Tax=Brevibacterium aurantiacum TaxID=273384 RepID=A0A4Z0KKT0_BREAU|nr:alpha/beta hydrolase [Brevibacterium aurantiacum]
MIVRRGRGHSDAQGADYSLHTEIGDLRAWIDHLEQPVHLVGWSHGGTISLENAAQDARWISGYLRPCASSVR